MLTRAERAIMRPLIQDVLELMRSDPDFVLQIRALVSAWNGSAANQTGAVTGL